MALERNIRPLTQCLQCTRHDRITLPIRAFSTSTPVREEVEAATSTKTTATATATATSRSRRPPLDPFNVITPREERKLLREQHKFPVSSRRRRAAMQSNAGIPFIELPYQCFQEARQFLQQDRDERLKEIQTFRERISRLQDQVVEGDKEKAKKAHRLRTMRTTLEYTKILADINDPMIKRRFEDGQGDMNKPIYRYLADQQWRSYKRKVLVQRITQMNVIPDVLPKIDPIVSTALSFPAPDSRGRIRKVPHGDFVDSRVSESAPILDIQSYEKGEKLYTIAVVNPDVPNVSKDGFDYRCHLLACNIPLSPTKITVNIGKLSEKSQIVLPWLPAYAQKGLPYQRMSVVVLEQRAEDIPQPGSAEVMPSQKIDIEHSKIKTSTKRLNFSLKHFAGIHRLRAVGIDLFRTQWDEGTAGVMERAGISGQDVEFKRKRIQPLPYKRLKEERYR